MTNPQPPIKPFLPALTGVRAFAAFWVLALHVSIVATALLPGSFAPVLGTLSRPGALGVDVFFVLSGFIISYNYAALFDEGFDLPRWGRFLWARLARVYPVHVVLLLALAVAVLGLGLGRDGQVPDSRWSISGLIESLLLVQAWLGHWDQWNAVSWSVSAEWLAYLCFPLLSAVALAVTGRVGAPVAWLAIVFVVSLPAVRYTFGQSTVGLLPELPLQILSEFLAGCMTYRLFASGGRPPALATRPGWLLLALVGAAALFLENGLEARWSVAIVPPMILGLAHGRGFLSRLFSTRWFVYWGKVSFALYMTHFLWLWILHTWLPLGGLLSHSLPVRVGLVLVHVLPTFAIAAATYHIIEEPARRRLLRLIGQPAASHRRRRVSSTALEPLELAVDERMKPLAAPRRI